MGRSKTGHLWAEGPGAIGSVERISPRLAYARAQREPAWNPIPLLNNIEGHSYEVRDERGRTVRRILGYPIEPSSTRTIGHRVLRRVVRPSPAMAIVLPAHHDQAIATIWPAVQRGPRYVEHPVSLGGAVVGSLDGAMRVIFGPDHEPVATVRRGWHGRTVRRWFIEPPHDLPEPLASVAIVAVICLQIGYKTEAGGA